MSVTVEGPEPERHWQRVGLVSPVRWRVWSLPRLVLGYVLAVDVAAVALVVLTALFTPITSTDLVRFLILTTAAVTHLEAVRRIERLREVAVDGTSYVNLKSLWVFAAVILLPLPLVAAVVATSYLYCWVRVYGHSLAFRKFFSAATFVLASGAAAAILAAVAPSSRPGIPDGPGGAVALVAAGAVWWLVNYAMVVGVLLLSAPNAPARKALGNLTDQLIVVGALGLGVGVAVMLVHQPWLVAILMVTVIALHQGLLLPQLQRAAQTDSKTGLMDPVYWHRMAQAELTRAGELGTTAALLMLDLDHFSRLNSSLGHPAADDVLRAAATAVRAEVRQSDLVGRFGGDELVVLMPSVTAHGVEAVARRIRWRLSHLVLEVTTNGGPAAVEGLTVSIGAAFFPNSATALDRLIVAADAALFQAKHEGRDRLCVAPGHTVPGVADERDGVPDGHRPSAS